MSSETWSTRSVGQVVFIVIDALRSDFIFPISELSQFGLHGIENGTKIEYVTRLVEGRDAVAFVARAHAPTVTLPRIKSLMSGTIPGFVDVVMNFGSTVLNEDNLIDQEPTTFY